MTKLYVGNMRGPQGLPGAPGAAGPRGPQGETYPLAAYGAKASSCAIDSVQTVTTIAQMYFTRIFVPAGVPITKVGMFIAEALAAPSADDKFVLYSDTGVMIGQTLGDITLWGTRQTWAFRSLITPIAAASADRYVYAAFFVTDPSSGKTAYAKLADGITFGGSGVVNRRAFFQDIAAPPASIVPTSDGNTSTSFIPLMLLA